MDMKVCGKLLTTHRKGYGVDVEALRGGFPSGRTPATAPRWDLTNTEGYGGGNISSVAPLMVSGYMGIYRRRKYVGGRPRDPRGWGRAYPPGRTLHPRGPPIAPPTYSFLLYIPTYPQTTIYGAKALIPMP